MEAEKGKGVEIVISNRLCFNMFFKIYISILSLDKLSSINKSLSISQPKPKP